jgi:hypothetical protein
MQYAWYPHPGPQEDFCSRPEFEVLYGGAAGGGKTDCLLIEAARYVGHPRYRALLLRRTFPQLQEVIDRAFHWYPQIDPGANYKSSEHRWYWSSGATTTLGHMQHENDKYNYQGKEFHFIGFDEATQFTQTQYTYLFSRARSTDPTIPCRIRATTNPGGIGHQWVYERFRLQDKRMWGTTIIDADTGMSRVFIPAKLTDNPTLADNDPLYVKRLMSLPEVERRRLMDGDWECFEGAAFPDLKEIYHACDPFPLPPEWEYFGVFDWGYSKPWSYLVFGVDYDDTLYLVHEVYGAREGDAVDVGVRQTNDEICARIRDEESSLRMKIRRRMADPACWGPTKINGRNDILGPSFAEDAIRHGLAFIKADNDRLRGRQQVHMRFQIDEEIDEATGELKDRRPRFAAFRTCKHFWRTMRSLQNNVKNPEDIDTDGEDHIYDCFRYGCMSRPVKPKKFHTIPPGSFQAERNRLVNAKKYATKHGVPLSVAYGRVR